MCMCDDKLRAAHSLSTTEGGVIKLFNSLQCIQHNVFTGISFDTHTTISFKRKSPFYKMPE